MLKGRKTRAYRAVSPEARSKLHDREIFHKHFFSRRLAIGEKCFHSWEKGGGFLRGWALQGSIRESIDSKRHFPRVPNARKKLGPNNAKQRQLTPKQGQKTWAG